MADDSGTHGEPPSYEALLAENRELKRKLKQMEQQNTSSDGALAAAPRNTASSAVASAAAVADQSITSPAAASAPSQWSHQLTSDQITRYSRQLLLSELGGADTQARLLRARVLVVGAGGLGAPVCLYLAAAGIGHMTIVDSDVVELSNLHRQVIHTEASIGVAKATSAARAVRALNSDVQVRTVLERFTEANAVQLAEACDVIVDASDNVATRYLLNDVAITCGKVLVSGSALRMEGQVSVFGLHGGPCYRCLYPRPPPPSSVTNCSDGGVLGAITGVIGSIQSLEVVKIVAGLIEHPDAAAAAPYPPLSAQSRDFDPAIAAATMSSLNCKLLLFDGCSSSFRCVKLRPRNKECAVCGDAPTITKQTLVDNAIDYQLFCGSANHDGPAAANVATTAKSAASKVPTASVRQLQQAFLAAQSNTDASSSAHSVAGTSTAAAPLLLDVREPVQYRICALPGAVNVPLRVLKQEVPAWLKHILAAAPTSADATATAPDPPVIQSSTLHPGSASAPTFSVPPRDIFVMCRRGVDSVAATRLIVAEMQRQQEAKHETAAESAENTAATAAAAAASAPSVRHVSGGLQAWCEQIDADFPLY